MTSLTEQTILRFVRLARGVEAGGYLNLSKLLWSMAYSEEIKATNATIIPRGELLINELESLLAELKMQDAPGDLIQELERGIDSVREDRTSSYKEIPDPSVSRTTGDIFLIKPSERTDKGDDPLDLRVFLPSYYLEMMKPTEVITALKSYPGEITSLVEGLHKQQLEQLPVPGEWSVRELFWHFAMAQKVLEGRLEQMLAADNIILKSVAVWAMQSEELSTEQILDLYRESRQKTLILLESLAADDWWRSGWHDEFGHVTLLQQACYFARHERSHMAQLVSTIMAVT